MSFDLNWEQEVYSKKKQRNDYPFEWVIASTKKYVKNYKSKKVIEMGSGTGNNLRLFNNLGFSEIVGVEGSKSAVNISQRIFKNNKKVKILLDDFSTVKFKKNKFDLCLDRGSITHNNKKDVKKIINNIHYFLKPGGYFFSSLFSNNHYAFSNKKFFFKKEIKSKLGLVASFFSEKEIKTYFNKFKYISIVYDSKFEINNKRKKDCWWYLILQK